MKNNIIIILILGILFICNTSYPQEEKVIPFTTVAEGDACGIKGNKKLIINNKEKWKNLCTEIVKGSPRDKAPYFDFNITTLIGIFIGNCSPAYDLVEIVKIVENDEKIIVYYKQFVVFPKGNKITQPFCIVSIGKTNKNIEFIRQKPRNEEGKIYDQSRRMASIQYVVSGSSEKKSLLVNEPIKVKVGEALQLFITCGSPLEWVGKSEVSVDEDKKEIYIIITTIHFSTDEGYKENLFAEKISTATSGKYKVFENNVYSGTIIVE